MTFKRLLIEMGIVAAAIGLLLWLGLKAAKSGVGVIPPNTDATISIEGSKVTIEKNNERIIKYAPKGTKITINKDGSIKVVSKQFGLTREWGVGLLTDGRHVAVQGDVKFLYYKRLGLHLNLGVTTVDKRLLFIPALSLSYNLPWAPVSNTSIFIGHSLVKQDDWVAGARVRF